MALVDIRFLQIVLLLTLLVMGCKESPLKFSIRYDTLGELKPNVPIYFEKTPVGNVDRIVSTEQGGYAVEVSIDPECKRTATDNSRFFIADDPFYSGRQAIIIEQDRHGGTILADGSVVQGESSRGRWGEFMRSLKQTTRQASERLRASLQTMQQSVAQNTHSLNQQLEQSLDDLDRSFQDFDRSMQSTLNDVDLERLKQAVDRFIAEFKSSSEAVRDTIRHEILPKLRRNLEALRDRLKNEGRDSDAEEIDRQIDEIVRV